MKGIDKNNCEEWFFEYFEGGLNTEEKNLVMDFIERDPIYREEFEYWEKSYVREPLPGKLKIEGKLLKIDSTIHYYTYSGIALLILTALVYFNLPNEKAELPLNIPDKKNILFKNQETQLPITQKRLTDQLELTAKKNKLPTPLSAKYSDTALSEITPAIPEKTSETKIQADQPKENLVELKLDSNYDSTTIAAEEEQKDTAAIIATKRTRKEERRERRKNEKFKQKSLEKKQAEEFLKGKVPYVVPVNPINF